MGGAIILAVMKYPSRRSVLFCVFLLVLQSVALFVVNQGHEARVMFLILTSLVRRSRTALTVSIQRRPIRSMATATRVSPAASLASRARQAGAAVGPGAS